MAKPILYSVLWRKCCRGLKNTWGKTATCVAGLAILVALLADGTALFDRLMGKDSPASASAALTDERLMWLAPSLRNATSGPTPTISDLSPGQKLRVQDDIRVPLPTGITDERDLDRLAVVSVYQAASEANRLGVAVYPSSDFRKDDVDWNWVVDPGIRHQSLFLVEADQAFNQDACAELKTQLENAINQAGEPGQVHGRLYWASHVDPRPDHTETNTPRLTEQTAPRRHEAARFDEVYLNKVYADAGASFDLSGAQLALAEPSESGGYVPRGPQAGSTATPPPHWIEAVHQALSRNVLAFQGVSFEVDPYQVNPVASRDP